MLKGKLSAEELFGIAYRSFAKIQKAKPLQEPQRNREPVIPLVHCLMSGLAVFSLKYPSLLQFENSRWEENNRHNLKTLFGVEYAPSDTQLRERLDEVDPIDLRKPYKEIFSRLQRGKFLESYQYLGGYLLSIDGTGYFSSSDIHCENCCEKEHRNGTKTYYHQMLGAAIVHPDHKIVIPFAPEPIIKQDGIKKNDCERHASKRFLEHFRREHPHLKVIVVEDGLSSNEPHIKTLKDLGFSFILGIKPGDHTFLFDWIERQDYTEYEITDEEGTVHQFRFINDAPLNEKNFECKINFVEYSEIRKSRKTQHFSWATDITVTQENVFKIMRGGRARWRIENETFNTLKNRGYQFEHNFGHGYRYLSTVFAMLMVLAFLIDQTQALCCSFFKKAAAYKRTKMRLWESLRTAFDFFLIDSWQALFHFIGEAPKKETAIRLSWNTS